MNVVSEDRAPTFFCLLFACYVRIVFFKFLEFVEMFSFYPREFTSLCPLFSDARLSKLHEEFERKKFKSVSP